MYGVEIKIDTWYFASINCLQYASPSWMAKNIHFHSLLSYHIEHALEKELSRCAFFLSQPCSQNLWHFLLSIANFDVNTFHDDLDFLIPHCYNDPGIAIYLQTQHFRNKNTKYINMFAMMFDDKKNLLNCFLGLIRWPTWLKLIWCTIQKQWLKFLTPSPFRFVWGGPMPWGHLCAQRIS